MVVFFSASNYKSIFLIISIFLSLSFSYSLNIFYKILISTLNHYDFFEGSLSPNLGWSPLQFFAILLTKLRKGMSYCMAL